jgi:hypothetical protein
MKQELIDNLKSGLYLESSNQLLTWQISFNSLKQLPNSTIVKQSDERTDLIWKNEKILNGIAVDIVVMRRVGIFNINRRFNYALAYITEKDFEKIKIKLDNELGQVGKYKKMSDLEYKYTWELSHTKIRLIKEDRFGPYWTINIRYKALWQRLLK